MAKTMLVTGGTVFVSRSIAEYYVAKGYCVYVLNRNSREQPKGVRLIQADRHALGDRLRGLSFDVVVDTAYNARDVETLLSALGGCQDYILISSSAVYPETAAQPFTESTPLAPNRFWGRYGTDKIEAEATLLRAKPDAYIIRPPYLYGPLNNVYREAFVFDCALAGRTFYLPKDGKMKLQFFYIGDLCRFTELLLEAKPSRHIFNVGNQESVSVRKWAELCYQAAGREARFENVYMDVEQRNYFSFYNYEYCLDVSEQHRLMPSVTPLAEGLKRSFGWYKGNMEKVTKRPYGEYIDSHLI